MRDGQDLDIIVAMWGKLKAFFTGDHVFVSSGAGDVKQTYWKTHDGVWVKVELLSAGAFGPRLDKLSAGSVILGGDHGVPVLNPTELLRCKLKAGKLRESEKDVPDIEWLHDHHSKDIDLGRAVQGMDEEEIDEVVGPSKRSAELRKWLYQGL